MKNEMIKGYIDAIILSVLAPTDSYGYEIAKRVNERTEGALELKEGTLYPALKRLESEQLIEGYWGAEAQGPRRRYYRITDCGRQKLGQTAHEWRTLMRTIGLFLREVES